MHSLDSVGSVPAFLSKLWTLVEDAATDDLIKWGSDGRSFIISNQSKFAEELLPQYFKHNNLASFIRQLNMYGFHKVVSCDSGGLRSDKAEIEFRHDSFLRGQYKMLANIKRKQTRKILGDDLLFTSNTNENVHMQALVKELKMRKKESDSIQVKLKGLERENEALWREYTHMRQKFNKQQQILQKLIQFLVALVKNPGKHLVPKRKFNQLALEAASSETSYSPFDLLLGGGPVIHEVTDLVETGDPVLSNSPAQLSPSCKTNSDFVIFEEFPKKFKCEIDSTDVENMIPVDHLACEENTPDNTDLENLIVHVPDSPVSETSFDLPCDTKYSPPASPDIMHTVNLADVSPSLVVLRKDNSFPKQASPVSSSSETEKKQLNVINETYPTWGGNTEPDGAYMGSSQLPLLSSDSRSAVSLMPNPLNKQEIEDYVDDMTLTVETMEDLLANGNLNIDPSFLTMFDNAFLDFEFPTSSNEVSGTEVSVYNSGLGLTDLEEIEPKDTSSTLKMTELENDDTLQTPVVIRSPFRFSSSK